MVGEVVVSPEKVREMMSSALHPVTRELAEIRRLLTEKDWAPEWQRRPWWTVKDIMAAYGVGRSTVYDRVKARLLPRGEKGPDGKVRWPGREVLACFGEPRS